MKHPPYLWLCHRFYMNKNVQKAMPVPKCLIMNIAIKFKPLFMLTQNGSNFADWASILAFFLRRFSYTLMRAHARVYCGCICVILCLTKRVYLANRLVCMSRSLCMIDLWGFLKSQLNGSVTSLSIGPSLSLYIYIYIYIYLSLYLSKLYFFLSLLTCSHFLGLANTGIGIW